MTFAALIAASLGVAGLAIVRDFAPREVRGFILWWCERKLERAASQLPAEEAADVLSEMRADLQQRLEDRGVVAAFLWARSAAREAIPTMAADRTDSCADTPPRWRAGVAVRFLVSVPLALSFFPIVWSSLHLVALGSLGRLMTAASVTAALFVQARVLGVLLAWLLGPRMEHRRSDGARATRRVQVAAAACMFLVAVALLGTASMAREAAMVQGTWTRIETGWIPNEYVASRSDLDFVFWLSICNFLALTALAAWGTIRGQQRTSEAFRKESLVPVGNP